MYHEFTTEVTNMYTKGVFHTQIEIYIHAGARM